MTFYQDHNTPFRKGLPYTRVDSRGERDHAYVLGRHGGIVLYNVESQNGDRFKHRVLDEATFATRWSVA